MPSPAEAAFERHLRGLSPGEFARFVADLRAARGWETRVEDGTVIATRGNEERVIVVRHGGRLFGDPAGWGTDREDAAAVVTSGGGGGAARLARDLDADLVTAADLHEQFVYALDAETRERLVDAYFAGTPPVSAWLAPRELARSVDGAREAVRTSRRAAAVALVVAVVSLLVVAGVTMPLPPEGGATGGPATPAPSVTVASPLAGASTPGTPANRVRIGAGTDAWRTFRGGPGHSGWRPDAIGPDDGTILATFDAGGPVFASPAVVNGTVYVGAMVPLGIERTTGVLYALDAATLSPRWNRSLGESLAASPTVANDTVYVVSLAWRRAGSGSGFEEFTAVHAVGATVPRRRWGTRISSRRVPQSGITITFSPTLANGTLYVGGMGGHVHALAARSGERRWTVETNGTVFASPAVVDGTVYVGTTDGTVYALDATDGSVRWMFPAGGGIVSSAAVVDGVVYVASVEGIVYALDAGTGTEVWNRWIGDRLSASPAVTDTTVYVGTRSGDLYAIHAADGSVRWRRDTDGSVFHSPVVVDGTVYVGGSGGGIYAFDAATGEQRWVVRTDGRVLSSPAVANGVLYVGTDNGTVYAIGDPTRDG